MSCVIKVIVFAFSVLAVIGATPNNENEKIALENLKSIKALEYQQLRHKRTPSGGGGVNIENFHIHNVTGGQINFVGTMNCGQCGAHTQRSTLPKKFSLSYDRVNFIQAFMNCRAAGMELATIENEKESRDLDAYLDPYKVDGYDYSFYLAGTHLNQAPNLQYYWLTTGKPLVFANWMPKDPNNPNGCITWTLYQGHTGWIDLQCERLHRYVCQYRD